MPNYHTWNDSPTAIVIIDASSLLSHGLSTFPDMFNPMQLEGNATTRSNGSNLCSLYLMQKPSQLIYKQDSGKLNGFELQSECYPIHHYIMLSKTDSFLDLKTILPQ